MKGNTKNNWQEANQQSLMTALAEMREAWVSCRFDIMPVDIIFFLYEPLFIIIRIYINPHTAITARCFFKPAVGKTILLQHNTPLMNTISNILYKSNHNIMQFKFKTLGLNNKKRGLLAPDLFKQ